MSVRLSHISSPPLLVLAAFFGGCGGDQAATDLAPLAELTPPDAPLFVEAALRPDDEHRDIIDSLIEKFGIPDPGSEIVTGVDGLFASNGLELSYADDIEPWLGEQGALFVSSFAPSPALQGAPEFAAMLEVSDSGAATEFVNRLRDLDPTLEEERSYDDYSYEFSGSGDTGFAIGIVDEALIFGTETSFKAAVDAKNGESLAEDEQFSERVEALGDEALATVFAEPSTAIEAAIASEDISKADADLIRPLLAGPLSSPIAISIDGSEDAASIEAVAMPDGSDAVSTDSELLAALPAGSWIAFAAPDVGAMLERGLDQFENSGLPGAESITEYVRRQAGLDPSADLASWLGDLSAYVGGSSPAELRAGVVAETSDSEGPRNLLEAAQRFLEQEEPRAPIGPAPEGAEYGFSVRVPGAPIGLEVGVIDGHLAAAVGDTLSEAVEPGESLGADDAFEAATESLGDDFAPVLYIDLPSLFGVAEAGGAASEPGYAAAKPYLGTFSYLIAGARADDELVVNRITVGLDGE